MGDTSKSLVRLGLFVVLIMVVTFLVVGLQRILTSISNLQQNNITTVERMLDDAFVIERRPANVGSPVVWVGNEIPIHLFPNTLLTQNVLCELA